MKLRRPDRIPTSSEILKWKEIVKHDKTAYATRLTQSLVDQQDGKSNEEAGDHRGRSSGEDLPT